MDMNYGNRTAPLQHQSSKRYLPGLRQLNPTYFIDVNGTIFRAQDNTNGYELWKSDGTTAGTSLVKDIYPG